MSIAVPEGKVYDISGNLNMASNQLEVKHCMSQFLLLFYSISISVHSHISFFVLNLLVMIH